MMATRRTAWLAWFAVAVLLWAHGDDAGVAPEPVGVRSHWSTTQRFLGVGNRSEEIVGVLVWMEDLADRLAKFIGQPIPATRGVPLRVVVREDPATADGRIEFFQKSSGQGWHQEVVVYNPSRANPEEFLDVVTFLLLSRYPQSVQSLAERRERPASVPAWWADGVARHVFPVLRLRAHEEVCRAWQEGRCLSLERILAPRPWRPGPSPEKAYAAVAVGWMAGRREDGEPLADRFRRWAHGRFDDLSFWVQRAGTGGLREAEIRWELAIAALTRRASRFEPASAGELAAFRDALELRRGHVPRAWPADVPEPVPLEMLIERRGETWVSEAAHELAFACDRFRVGRDAEMRGCVDEFLRFFLQMQRADPASATGREERALRDQLQRAREALARLEIRARARNSEAGTGDGPRVPDARRSPGKLEDLAGLEIQLDAFRRETAPATP